MFFVLLTIASWAYDAEVDGIYYNLDKEAKIAEVTRSDISQYFEDVVIPESITVEGVAYSVTSIGNEAFMGCYELNSVIIPNSVTRIGDKAFLLCSCLTYVTIPNSVTSIDDKAFDACTSLPVVNNLRYADTFLVEAVDKSCTSAIIKEGTRWIGDKAFMYCSGMTSVTIPNSVERIGMYAFSCCSDLTSVTIPNSVKTIGMYAFSSCSDLTSVTIPNSVKSIDDGAFSGCSSLTSLIIHDSVTSIDDYAFEGCSGLISVEIPNSVTSIGDGAFRYCSHLTSVTIPNSVASIGNGAFANCESLQSISIPANVTSMGAGIFQYCYQLQSANIPDNIKTIPINCFDGCKSLKDITLPTDYIEIGTAAFCGCESLTSFQIPETVTKIGQGPFSSSGITSVYIPKNVSYIDTPAFFSIEAMVDEENEYYSSIDGVLFNKEQTILLGFPRQREGDYVVPSGVKIIGEDSFCDVKINSVEISNGVEEIKKWAFSHCANLKVVSIPESVTNIGYWAFDDCKSLAHVKNFSKTPQDIYHNGMSAFRWYGVLHVLPGYKDVYENSLGWRNFKIYDDLDTTSISTCTTDENNDDYIDLQGRKLNSEPERGIYIKDGKKVVR